MLHSNVSYAELYESLGYIGYVSAALYLLLGLFSFIGSILLWKRDDSGYSFIKIILTMLPIQVLARGVILSIRPQLLFLSMEQQEFYDILLGSIPGYLFISCYSLLAIFWVVLAHYITNQDLNLVNIVKTTYGFINILVYTGWFSWLALMYMAPDKHTKNLWHKVEVIFNSACSNFISVLFCTFGCRIFFHLRNLQNPSLLRKKLTRKVAWLTAICMLAFILRGMELAFFAFYPATPLISFILDLFFLYVCDFIPNMLIFILLSPVVLQICSTTKKDNGDFDETKPLNPKCQKLVDVND